MKKLFFLFFIVFFSSCKELLEPAPVNVLTNKIVLSSPNDVENVRIGLYSAFRNIAAPVVIAGDFTADMLAFRGTFTQYQELVNKQITASNAVVASLWGSIYNTVYISNFILERLPDLAGVPASTKKDVLATARFLRGYALFIGVNTYGDIPLPTTSDVETNKTIPKTSKEDILKFILEDYTYALENINAEPFSPAFAGVDAVKAALARYHLYLSNWLDAETYASDVINSGNYTLVDFEEVVEKDFTDESILEVGYSITDDPGTSSLSLNNIFKGRREVIPANVIVNALFSNESQDRIKTISFDNKNQIGNDNGWTVEKYGTSDNDNNNIVIFRLAEMYLIRAEARAMQGKITGAASAEEDINVLRNRANANLVTGTSQNQMLLAIEKERLYELAYEGHRWYDLKRTGRLDQVMIEFSSNWKPFYNLWPIPLREIQNNTSLKDAQNPGY